MIKFISTTKIQKAVIIIAAVGFFSALIYMNLKPGLPVFLKKDETVSEAVAEDGEIIIEVKENTSTIETEFHLDMSDDEVAVSIHAMSHQKVKSEDNEKWGPKVPLTQERVERLIEVVKSRQHDDNFENEDIYLEILNRWAEGDFSQIAREHNHIWYNQHGNTGYATGILSPEEEMEYIRVNFKVNE